MSRVPTGIAPLAFVALALVALTATACEPTHGSVSSVVLSDLEGREFDPFAGNDAPATVFLFARTDCPISNRYAPELRQLHERFSTKGVKFWLVYLDRDESPDEIAGHMSEYGYPFDALRDLKHELVAITGAKVTPEAAVFDPDGKMVYRGRIDDRYVDFGKTRSEPTTHDLERALTAILEGRSVDPAVTPAIGCFIPDLE